MLRILLKQPESERDADNLVRMVIGSAAPTDVVEEFERRYDVAVLDVYGLSETGPIAAVTWDQRRPGSCGRPVPWYEVRIFDDHDLEVPRGQAGQIVVRPNRPHVMMERYWGNDSATLALMRNLWFHTGDYARQDEDGYIWFLERATDSIRRRGENVSAWEVERVFADHPDLLEAAVYGVPSEVGGEEIMVAVVPQAGMSRSRHQELLDFCTGKMPHFAVPRYVRFMDKLPRYHAQRVLKQAAKGRGRRGRGRMGPRGGRLRGSALRGDGMGRGRSQGRGRHRRRSRESAARSACGWRPRAPASPCSTSVPRPARETLALIGRRRGRARMRRG